MRMSFSLLPVRKHTNRIELEKLWVVEQSSQVLAPNRAQAGDALKDVLGGSIPGNDVDGELHGPCGFASTKRFTGQELAVAIGDQKAA
jgi:hypothetical protein